MKRTKHIVNILTAAVTLLLTASCNVSYPDLDLPQGEPPTNDEDVNIDKTSILLYTSNPAYFSVVSDTRGSVGTRGTGAFEPMETVAYNREKYLNAKFNIFAFRAYNDADRECSRRHPLCRDTAMLKMRAETTMTRITHRVCSTDQITNWVCRSSSSPTSLSAQ